MQDQAIDQFGQWKVMMNELLKLNRNWHLSLELAAEALPHATKSAKFTANFSPVGLDTYLFDVEANLGEGLQPYRLYFANDAEPLPPRVCPDGRTFIAMEQKVRRAGKKLAIALVESLPDLTFFGCRPMFANDYLLKQWQKAPWR